MIDTLRGTSEGEAERGVLSENRSGAESLVGRSRNFVLAVVAAAGMSGCLPYAYGPSHGYYQNDNGYRSSAPTHVIKAFPLRIERIDRHNDNRGSHHHNDQRGNHRGNHRR